MSVYRWVEADEVRLFHDRCVRETGGLQGIRDDKLLESALGKPKNLAAYENPSVYELAASYAEGIARNHPFADGNKRTALIVAGRFLDIHGIELAPERNNELTEMVEGLAQGTVSREAFADHLRANSHELQSVEQPSPEPLQEQDSGLSAETSTLTPEQERQAGIDAIHAEREARDAQERDQPGPERGW